MASPLEALYDTPILVHFNAEYALSKEAVCTMYKVFGTNPPPPTNKASSLSLDHIDSPSIYSRVIVQR